VSHNTPSLVELFRAQGDGWRSFIGAAERGEAWAAPGVSVGIGGEASEDVNWIVAYGPEGVAEGVASGAAALHRRTLPGSVYAASMVAPEVSEDAASLGFAPAGHVPLMFAHATDIVRASDEHETRVVDDMETILAAGDILADAFELPVDWCRRLVGVGFERLPGVVACLALHDGRPVAVAGSALAGDIAGIYAVGTKVAHRDRGAGAAAMTAVVDHQIRAGAHWFGLLSAPPAEPFYAGLGFATVDHPGVWVLRPE
jgi:hypothetical protein